LAAELSIELDLYGSAGLLAAGIDPYLAVISPVDGYTLDACDLCESTVGKSTARSWAGTKLASCKCRISEHFLFGVLTGLCYKGRLRKGGPVRESPPERKHRRFDLSYPVRMTLQSGGSPCEIEAISRNISIGGFLLEATSRVPQNSEVSFVMTIQDGRMVHPVEVVGQGHVVRVEEELSSAVRLAVECTSPMTQIESYFPRPS